jgi:NAD(P)-dependent dehydrogenase (short-subunit alcohol dehydrogenase family)
MEVVKTLLKKGCHVITGSSANEEEIQKRLKTIMEELGDENKGTLNIWSLNLSSMHSVMEFINKFKQSSLNLNYMICNGAVMFTPFNLTEDNFETHLATNYFSHCLLIHHLLPLLVESAKQSGQKSRIVCVSSGAHRPANIRINDLQSLKLYSTYHAYAQSKLAQIMFVYKFNEWLMSKKEFADFVTINSLHPGVCRTDMMKEFNFFNLKGIQALPIFRVI